LLVISEKTPAFLLHNVGIEKSHRHAGRQTEQAGVDSEKSTRRLAVRIHVSKDAVNLDRPEEG